MNLALRNLYKDTSASLWSSHILSEICETKTGVKQDCILSPLLFSIFFNDIGDNFVDIRTHAVRLFLWHVLY